MNKKVCVVGAGYWGKNHIRTLHEMSALGGVVEQDRNLLDQIAAKYENINFFENLDEAIQSKIFNGFIVATPAETHHDVAIKIIKSRNSLLVEKPLCLNLEDAKNLIELSITYDVNLMVGHLLLFHPAIQKIKSLIDKGYIGKPQYIYSNRLNLGQVRTKENVFWSLAPHDISIFQYLSDSYPEKILANGSSFLQKGIYDSTITYLKYPNGIEGHIYVSWLHPFKEHRLVVVGSEAMIVFEDSIKGKPLKLFSKKIDFNSGSFHKIDGPVKLISYDEKLALNEELNYFVKHLDKKKPSIANGNHAFEVMKILVEASAKLQN